MTTNARRVGDIVKVFAGTEDEYIGKLVHLFPEKHDAHEECVLCEPSENCREWYNVEVLKADLSTTGSHAYHVPEHHMQDFPRM